MLVPVTWILVSVGIFSQVQSIPQQWNNRGDWSGSDSRSPPNYRHFVENKFGQTSPYGRFPDSGRVPAQISFTQSDGQTSQHARVSNPGRRPVQISFTQSEGQTSPYARVSDPGRVPGRVPAQISFTRSDEFGFGNVDKDKQKRELCNNVRGNLSLYRYDTNAKKCSRIGLQSHCGENMAFYGVEHNELYGRCDCAYNSQRPLIYHEASKRCYFVYDQAFCRKGEWLSYRKGEATPGCNFNKCQTPSFRTKRRNRNVYVPFKGNGPCVLLGQRHELCSNSDEVVGFAPGVVTPRCVPLSPEIRGLALARSLKCKPGSYLNVVGRCQPPFVW